MRSGWREIFGAGAPGWYSLLALSFLFCEFNPIAAIGVAAGLKHDYSGPIGWALTAISFMISLAGLISAARIAFVDRNRRALEIAGIATVGAGVVPLLVGVAMPALIMWPISAMFFITGASGLRASGTLPHPNRADHWSARDVPPETPSTTAAEPSPRSPGATQSAANAQSSARPRPEQRRRRRGRRRRRRSPPRP
jgi:hypothetical protein